MDPKLSEREAALVAQARREAGARKAGSPSGDDRATSPVPPPPPRDKPGESPDKRLARLMAEERAETERRKKKMRRYGVAVPLAIAALFALWVLRAFRRRR